MKHRYSVPMTENHGRRAVGATTALSCCPLGADESMPTSIKNELEPSDEQSTAFYRTRFEVMSA